jgi:hypothetical protein
MLAGMMIPVPFILWLIFTLFDFGNIDQLFAFFGILGIALNFTKFKNNLWVSIISFLLMLSAVASRLMYVSVEALNYFVFTIPFSVFVITKLMIIFFNIKKAIGTSTFEA